MTIIKKIIQLGIGSVFIIAAFLKLLSIDEFEIYLYSFNVINFFVTTILSRLIIAGELILGLFLVFDLYHKLTWRLTLCVECVFTIFLIFTAIFRNDANCHCFGDLIELNPIESIVKNIVVILLLLFIKTQRHRDAETQRRVLPLLIVACALLVVFVITPMDSVYNKIFSTEKNISTIDLYDSFDDMFKIEFTDEEMTIDSTTTFIPIKEKQLLAIVSSGCKYCKIGIKKLSLIARNKNIDVDKINIVIWGNREGIVDFREVTDTYSYPYWYIMPHQAIDITYGRFPMFIYMEDTEIVDISDFRNIDDNISL